MKSKDSCYIDEMDNLNWKIYHYRPNIIIAIFMLILASLIVGLVFFHNESSLNIFYIKNISDISFPMWISISVLIILYLTLIYEIIKRIFVDYIVGVNFYKDNLQILYKRSNVKNISYNEIGFINFSLTEGAETNERFYPNFSFYYKNKSVNISDDLMYKKGYLIFKGEITSKEDYLILKKFLFDKKLHFHEPKQTIETFEKGRL